MRVSGQALLGRRTPVLEWEGAGHRDFEAALGGELGVPSENVVSLCAALVEVEPYAQVPCGGEVAEGQYPVWVGTVRMRSGSALLTGPASSATSTGPPASVVTRSAMPSP